VTPAARDFADVRPEFAVEAGLAALRGLVEGLGYEITSADVWAAYTETMKAAEKAGALTWHGRESGHSSRARLTASASSAGRSVGRWVSDPREGQSLQMCQRTTTDSSPCRFRVERTVT
jgi:hypothetical protein